MLFISSLRFLCCGALRQGIERSLVIFAVPLMVSSLLFVLTSCSENNTTIVQAKTNDYAPTLTMSIQPSDWERVTPTSVRAVVAIGDLFNRIPNNTIVTFNVQAFVLLGSQWYTVPYLNVQQATEIRWQWNRSEAILTMVSLNSNPLAIPTGSTTIRFVTF